MQTKYKEKIGFLQFFHSFPTNQFVLAIHTYQQNNKVGPDQNYILSVYQHTNCFQIIALLS